MVENDNILSIDDVFFNNLVEPFNRELAAEDLSSCWQGRKRFTKIDIRGAGDSSLLKGDLATRYPILPDEIR